jgi:hypothetical protein
VGLRVPPQNPQRRPRSNNPHNSLRHNNQLYNSLPYNSQQRKT